MTPPPAAASSSFQDEELEEKQKKRSARKKPKSERKKKKKKQKKVDVVDEGEQDKEEIEKNSMLIQRLWSEEDELVILKGMIENKKKGGVDPLSNLKEFLESIKKSLQVKEVKQEQLKNKIQRLKKKFMNNSKRAKGDGDPVFSKPHEKLLYTLMKEIWGSGAISMMDLDDSSRDENGAKKGDLEQKWSRLIADELKLYLRRIDLVREQTFASINADK